MMSEVNYILKNGRVVDVNRNIDEVMDLGIQNGKMADPAKVKNPIVVDCKDKVIAPGFIDVHVHLRQPGNTSAANCLKYSIAPGVSAAGLVLGIGTIAVNPPAAAASVPVLTVSAAVLPG